MHVLAIESEETAVELLSVAVERARPGTTLRFAADLDAALVALKEPGRARLPALVLLGPRACGNAEPAQLAALRAALVREVPVLALAGSPGEAARARAAGLDAIYRYELDWVRLSGEVRKLLTEWLRSR